MPPPQHLPVDYRSDQIELNTPSFEPSSHNDVADAQRREQRVSSELPTLVIDECLIYAESQPQRPLYELDSLPTIEISHMRGIKKFIYEPPTSSREGKIRSRKRHIYGFRPDPAPRLDTNVVLACKASADFTFKGVKVKPGLAGPWSTCKVPGHFRSEQSIHQRLKNKDQIIWKDTAGRVIAVETKLTRKNDFKRSVDRLPRMEIKVQLETKELTLLVTAWSVRIWNKSSWELREPFSWDKCEPSLLSYPGAVVLTRRIPDNRVAAMSWLSKKDPYSVASLQEAFVGIS